MTDTTEPKYRTITLTDAPPVRIREDNWPIIAHGVYRWHNDRNGLRSQANRKIDVDIRVRQHADGRAIVYGVYQYDTHWQHEENLVCKVGRLCDAGTDLTALTAAIKEIGAALEAQVNERRPDETVDVRIAVRDAISELPAVDL